ncbi:MAG: hypothetical protein A4E55_02201 [Pelotomaculum sp. PtaU1.Bin035]|nr:MAG: hypothetical protein A4E55_02201 [Pelotomaculum sp. PtaU1.Bin035]
MEENQTEVSYLEEVSEILSKLRPQFRMDRGCKTGNGKVGESIFAFSPKGRYYWVVIVCGTGSFAYKHITPEWIEIYSNLILLSSEVFVEWNINHYITNWAVEQDKICEFYLKEEKVRAV